MKKILSSLAMIVLIIACKKTDVPVHQDEEQTTTATNKKGGSSTSITTDAATIITSATATSGGTIPTGGKPVTERGICYNTSPNPNITHTKVVSGSGTGSFVSIMYGLSANTTYYVRAYATRSSGTTYGNQVIFSTYPSYGTVADADGNVYNTITIGTQVWTVENLKTTKYRGGTLIPNVTDITEWHSLTDGAYCNYNNDAGNVSTYGRLYNWYAATDSRNIAPGGWHLPSYAEWQTLRNYLGGPNIAGGKAKEAGLAHWLSPNTGADNSSGFTALPGGSRYYMYTDGGCTPSSPVIFTGLGNTGTWWTSTTAGSNPNDALFVETDNNSTNFYRSVFLGCFGYYDKRTGYSIRLVRD